MCMFIFSKYNMKNVYCERFSAVYAISNTNLLWRVGSSEKYCFLIKKLQWSADAIYLDLFQLTNIIEFTQTFLPITLLLPTCFSIP